VEPGEVPKHEASAESGCAPLVEVAIDLGDPLIKGAGRSEELAIMSQIVDADFEEVDKNKK